MAWSSYFWIRSTGFPFDWLDRLSVLAQSPALSRHEAALAELNRIEREVIQATQARVPGSVAKLGRKFRERLPVKVNELATELRAEAAPLLDARDALLPILGECEPGLQSDFLAQLQSARENLVAFLSLPDAREALFLSNPEALQRIDALTERGVDHIDSRARQRIRLGWNYVQRLCAKNDTASFFGPVAWGRFVGADQPSLSVTASTPWLSSRKTFFEHWVVLRLTQAISADPQLRDSLPISLNPGCHVEDGLLHHPIGKTRKLDPLGTALLDAFRQAPATGLTRAALAGHLAARGFAGADAMALLEFLLSKNVLTAGFVIAPGSDRPLDQLARRLNRTAAADDAKAPWLALLANLETQRLAFETAGLDGRIAALDAMRQLLTDAGVDLSRVQGQMYVGRFPVYEDCARNLQVTLGGALAGAVKTQLQPVMALYSWLVGAVAVRLHDRYLLCWQALQAAAQTEQEQGVDFLSFLSQLMREDPKKPVTDEIRSMLRRSWAEITAQHKDTAEVSLTAADLGRLLQRLDGLEPRVAQCQVLCKDVHSPDFMLAARSLEAVERGDYRIVIGEVHPAVHTVSQPVAQPFCPYAREIAQEVQDLLAPRTLVVADSPETYQRSHIDWLDVPALMQVVLPNGGGHVAAERMLPSGRGRVVLQDGALVYRERQSGIEQDLLTVLPSDMHRVCFALAGELIGQAEDRRLTVGRLILKRRSWYVTGDLLPQGGEPGETLAGYLAWRSWAAGVGLPRHAFVKCESEPKPVYIDFCNPFALDLLASLAKKKEPMRFSEMRPAPDELWLMDDRGRYCAEFRTSCVGKIGRLLRPCRKPAAWQAQQDKE
ncbi:lantibiotic dehydratase family protein [Verminephrobacter eiseniae]|uniref:lantibiotic dehydratase family protein n=1 Tax=Verminephrobacter eiseniae TaxID=364317 RepID=UPI002237CBEE|nr:lantibiotic dehydratase family protein [Verminephrobacter eiseniae]MCW5236572.1 hypothetical protein [Verminephrobacter eiseniae]